MSVAKQIEEMQRMVFQKDQERLAKHREIEESRKEIERIGSQPPSVNQASEINVGQVPDQRAMENEAIANRKIAMFQERYGNNRSTVDENDGGEDHKKTIEKLASITKDELWNEFSGLDVNQKACVVGFLSMIKINPEAVGLNHNSDSLPSELPI